MKKPIVAALFILLNLSLIKASAQIKLAVADVKEILVQNSAGGMGGSTEATIKVIAEAGQWHSYLMRKITFSMDPRIKSHENNLPKSIALVDVALVNNLLKGIAVIKPAITPSTFGLTPAKLITELKNGAKLPLTQGPNFVKLITQQAIDTAIAKNVKYVSVMDYMEYSEVDIVTKSNDTVKIMSRVYCPTKQPWTIKNRVTYDMSVNNFIVAAIAGEDVPDKSALNISSLKECIYKYIDKENPNGPIATFKWKYYYPENVKVLSEHFIVSEGFSYGNVYQCKLQTKAMPANTALWASLDMTNAADIKAVIDYANLIDKFFKAGNFMFKYYGADINSQLAFDYNTSHSPYYSLNFLAKTLPGLAKTDSSQVIRCRVNVPDDSSEWMIFPDNKILLTNHAVTTPHGETAPFFHHKIRTLIGM
jgi:hypothetical protein